MGGDPIPRDQAGRRQETRWWWIRHAPVPDGGRIYGQHDLDCDCTDAAVFAALASELPGEAVWLTTNLARTRQTAAAIMAAVEGRFEAGARPAEIAALAEQHLGAWQGLVRRDFFAGRPEPRHRFWFGPASERPPGGESFADVCDRARAAIEHLTVEYAGRDIVVVAHGGTIRAALALALRLEPEAALAFIIENCSLTRLDHLGGGGPGEYCWRVVAVNHRPWGSRLAEEGRSAGPASTA